jgi:hypothetical protein
VKDNVPGVSSSAYELVGKELIRSREEVSLPRKQAVHERIEILWPEPVTGEPAVDRDGSARRDQFRRELGQDLRRVRAAIRETED